MFPSAGANKSRGKSTARKTAHFNVDPPAVIPALLFDDFTITAAMKDDVDLQNVVPVAASSRNVGRHSLHSVKLAMDHMEAKPTTTKVYFDVYCHGIAQHVNMPLLRLVHQFVTMIETVSVTRQQLGEVSSSSQSQSVDYRCHAKSDSKGSSSSTETTSPSVQSGTPLASTISPQYSESAHIDSISSQPQRPDQLSLRSLGSKTVVKSSYSKTTLHSPLHSYAESIMVASGELSSPAIAERTIIDEITENTPKCWHTLYHLLELYSILPETNTITRRASRSRCALSLFYFFDKHRFDVNCIVFTRVVSQLARRNRNLPSLLI